MQLARIEVEGIDEQVAVVWGKSSLLLKMRNGRRFEIKPGNMRRKDCEVTIDTANGNKRTIRFYTEDDAHQFVLDRRHYQARFTTNLRPY